MAKAVIALLALSCGLLCTPVSAEIQMSTGVTQDRSLPGPTRSYGRVVLDVPHMTQKPWHCVPTSTAMILAYFGRPHDPDDLKRRAEDYKPRAERNERFTAWKDMLHALSEIGEPWTIRDYPRTADGFDRGLDDVRASLRAGNPVMIDVHLDDGHTFVLIGFDDTRKVVYIRDPALNGSESRVLSYDALATSWHNHRFGPGRSAFFARS